MRNPREEAQARVGGRFDVRVLEPSPPAIAEPPFLADDPVAGGEVVPVARAGSRSWVDLCQEEDDAALLEWCHDRWLVRKPLMPLPEGFADTRASLHALAEHVLAPARHAATGKIGLRFTHHGFGTPYFADPRAGVETRQVRMDDDELVDGENRHWRCAPRAADGQQRDATTNRSRNVCPDERLNRGAIGRRRRVHTGDGGDHVQ